MRDLDALDLVSGRFGAFRISIGEGMAEMMSGGIRMALNDRDLPSQGLFSSLLHAVTAAIQSYAPSMAF